MKKIKYIFGESKVEMPWSAENEVIAMKEALNGEYTIEYVDGLENKPTQEDRIAALEAQLSAYEAAYTEGVNEA